MTRRSVFGTIVAFLGFVGVSTSAKAAVAIGGVTVSEPKWCLFLRDAENKLCFLELSDEVYPKTDVVIHMHRGYDRATALLVGQDSDLKRAYYAIMQPPAAKA